MLKPHGGELINRIIPEREKESILRDSSLYPSLKVDREVLLDVENIATGVFSPLRGFMTKEELFSIAYNMQLPDGNVWTIPILLQLKEEPSFSKGDSGQ